MPTELTERPRIDRLRLWWSDSFGLLKGAGNWLVSLAITSVARDHALKELASSQEAMSEGLSAAVDLHRAMKGKISPDDPAERELFELFSGVAIAQTKLIATAIDNGITPQPIDVRALTRPTSPQSSSSANALPQSGKSELLETPHHQEDHQEQANQSQQQTPSSEPQKRKRGRPPKTEQQEPTNGETQKRKRGRPQNPTT